MLVEELQSILEIEQMETQDTNHPLGNSGAYCVFPKSEEEISLLLQFASKNKKSISIIGGGTKRGFGGLRDSEFLVSLEKHTGIVEHSIGDLTLIVKAGTTIQEINDYLHVHKQMLPISATWPKKSTIGGVIAANESGPTRMKYGSARDIVLGLRVVYPDGKIIRTGGKVVKNVAGYDLNKLFIGSMGTLGVISEVTLKLRPIPKYESIVLVSFPDDETNELKRFILEVQDSNLEPTTLELLNETLSLQLTQKSGFTLAIAFSDVKEAVKYQEDWLTKNIPSCADVQILTDQASMFWEKFSLLPPNGSQPSIDTKEETTISLKIGTKNNDVLETLVETEQLARNYNLIVKCHGGCGHGITRVYVTGQSEKLLTFIREVRDCLHPIAGYVVITHMPLALRKEIDVWGNKPAHLPLLKAIKKAIDPKHLLNKERFVGGI